MQLFDTHTHIFSADYPLDVEEVLARAQAAGVAGLICVGTTAQDSSLAVQFAQLRPDCWATVGLHPHDAKDGQEAFVIMERLVSQGARHSPSKIVAIGECGLDYFYTHSPKDLQLAALRFQFELAQRAGLPMTFHVREAFDDFWPLFDEFPATRGVIHSFTDSQENLDKALTRGLYIGVNGIATFAKNDSQIEMYKRIPLERMVLETDAPFLTPVPLRGKVNESAYVSHVCKFLAELRQESEEEIAARTTQNALTLFNLQLS